MLYRFLFVSLLLIGCSSPDSSEATTENQVDQTATPSETITTTNDSSNTTVNSSSALAAEKQQIIDGFLSNLSRAMTLSPLQESTIRSIIESKPLEEINKAGPTRAEIRRVMEEEILTPTQVEEWKTFREKRKRPAVIIE